MYKNYTSVNVMDRDIQFGKEKRKGANSISNPLKPKYLFSLMVLIGILFTGFDAIAQTTTTFNYTGSNQTFVVPAGVTSISVKMWGAGGGGGNSSAGSGGSGAFVKGSLAVTPGQSLVFIVGGKGAYNSATGGFGGGGNAGAGSTGGSGGGYSGIFLTSVSQANVKAIAGGGGGGGYASSATYGGAGGNPNGTAASNYNSNYTGGGGATTSAGGAASQFNGSTSNPRNGPAGAALQGASSVTSTYSYGGGGGGGGYFGGGAGYSSGNNTFYSSGGGGGSSFTTNLTTVTNTIGTTNNSGATAQAPGSAETGYVAGIGNGGASGASGGNGLIIITYTLPVSAPTITSYTPNTNLCTGGGQTVTITGTNFIQVTAVKFNGVNAASYTVVNATTITAVTPASLGAGTVSVTNTGGTGTGGAYTVLASPTITITPTPANARICGSGTVSMTASGADTYIWTPTTALAPSSGTSATEVSSAAVTTVYTVKGTSTSTGCFGTATQTVTVGPAITMGTVSATPSTICSGATSVLNATASIVSAPYCTPVYSDRDGTDGLTVIALKNAAGTTTLYTRSSGLVALPCYDDQTALTTTTLTAGTSYQITATLNSGDGNVAAFMDFNHDGDFADSGETILANTSVAGSGSISVTFAVPAGALNGNTRLRIVERYGTSAATSCNTTGYGETEDYTVVITGGSNLLTYAWTPAGGLTPSASVANPTTPALTSDTTYNVTVTEPVSGCFVTGSTTITTTNVAPQVTTGPTDQSKCSGQTATFNVVVTGAGLSYQWRKGTTNVVNDARISGATTATLTITGLVAGDAANDYNVVITSTCGSGDPLVSNNAALILNDITATVSPTSASVCGSQLLNVTTAASPASFVWKRNGAVIPSATTSTYTATEQGTYTVVVTGGASGCTAPTATASIVIKANPGTVIMTPSSASVCTGENITLGASASNTNTTILREDFNGTATGWTTVNNSTGGVDPAAAAWSLYLSDGVAASNDSSNFILTNSDVQGENGITATILKSPAMDLSSYASASLSFYQFFRFNGSPDAAKVEVSTDNSSWTTLATYTSNQGSALAWAPVSFNLNAYTGPGKTTVYVRFKYDASWGYYWGIDNVLVTGTSTPTVTWSPTTELYSSLSPLTPYGGEAAGGVFAMPTTTRTYTARATANGCFTENTIAVTPKSLPEFTVSNVSLCSDNAFGVDVSPTGGDSDNTYIWSPTAGLSGGNIAVDGTSTSVDVIMAHPATTANYSVIANNNTTGCSSTPHPFTVTVSQQAIAAAATPASRIKSAGTSTTFTVSSLNAVEYQWQVNDGSGFVDIDGSYAPVGTESYSGATTATLTIHDIDELMSGFTYRAKVKGAGNCAFVTPSNAQEGVLTVQLIGFAANFPADATICESGDASFHIQTTGGTPENYIWQVSENGGAFTNITDGFDSATGFTYSGATTADLDITGITYSTNSYRYQVSIDDESVTSDFATLNVNKTIDITQVLQTNVSLCSLASTSSFTAKANGTISGVAWEYSTSASGPWTAVANGTPSNVTYSSALPSAATTDGERTATLSITSNGTTPVTGGPYFYRATFLKANGQCTDAVTTSGQLDVIAPTLSSQPASASVIVTNSATFTVGISGPATYQWQYSTSPSSGFQDIPTGSQTGASYSGTNSATLTVTTSGATPFAANNYYRARVTSGGCVVYSNAAQLTVTNYCAPTYANGPGTTNQITRVVLGTLTNNSGPATSPYYTLNTGVTIPDLIKFTTNSVQVTMGSDASQFAAVWIDYNQNGTFEASEGVVSSTNAGANGTASLSVTVPSTATLGQTRMRVRGGDDLALLTSQACGATNSVVGETEDYLVNIIPTPAPTITSLGASTACAGTSITINGTNLYGAVASGVTVNGVAVSSITSNTGSVLVAVINPATPAGSGTNLISVTAAGGVTPGSPTFTVSTAPTAVTVSGGGSTCGASLTLTASNGGSGTMYYQGITSNGTSTTTASSSQSVTASGTYYFRAQSAGGCWSPQGAAVVNFYTTPSAITVTPDAPSVCANSIQALTASGGINVPSTIGTGTTFLSLTNEQTAFCNRRANYVGQTIYTAAELNAAGISAGNITSLSYNISQNGDSQTNANFTVKIGHVGSQTVFGTTAFLSNAAFTTVYGPSTYTHTAPGLQLVTFSTPFVWNGIDNICVDVRMDGADATNNARTQFTATGINSSIYGYNDPTSGTLSASRLNILFGYTRQANPFTWSPTTDLYTDSGATIPYTGSPSATVYAKRATTGTYTVTATNPGGCSSTKNVTVTVDVLVGSAVTTTGTRCAATNFTATANRTGGGAPFHYAWNDGVGGVYPDAATVTVNKPAGTYNFDVTITDNCGGTTHSTASIVVRGLPTVSITSVTPADAKICGTGTVSMTATGAVSYAWTPTLGLTPAAGTSATEVSSATSTIPYTVTGTDANGCTNTATQTVTVGPAVTRPTVANTTATPATICSGGTSVLNTSSATPAAYLSSLVPFAPIASGANTVTLANAGVATTPLSSGSLDDGYWNGQPLPFNFTYDGTSYSAISIQTNGVVSFTAFGESQGYGSSPQMPNTANPNNIIGVFGDLDWSLGGKISSYTSGSAPNRVYVINYNGTPTPSAGGGFYNSANAPTALVNYQIQLFENGNKIQIHTTSIANDGSTLHTMGVENAGGTVASVISGRNNSTWALSNDGVQFVPQNLTYSWTGPNGFTSSLQSPTTPALTANATYAATATESVSGCSSASRNVTVTVQSLPNAGTNGTLTICSGTTVTASQLFARLGGTPQTGGTWSPALAGAGTYTYTVAATAPCTGSATATVTVTSQALPNAGTNGSLVICAGSTVTAPQLFAQLGGTPDAGGTWSPALAGAGTYTYTVAATSPCTVAVTSQVVVTTQAAPNAGNDGVYTICSGTNITLAQLQQAITGEDAGGTWSPALGGAGTYTYTVAPTSPCSAPDTSIVVVSTVSCAATQLSNCGNIPVLTSVNTRIFAANTITTAKLYRFRVAESTAPTTYYYAETIYPSFRLTDVVGLTPTYGTTYNVDIQNEFLINGNTVTSAFGPMCTVTTQAATNITVPTNQCGQTLAAINSKIYVNGVTGATMYTYRIAKQSAPTQYGYIETPYSNFRLTNTLTSGSVAIEHNTVYLVSVSVTTANGSSNFNGECLITTPVGPMTTIQASQCGDDETPYVIPTKSTKVYATDFVSGATYTFKLEQYDGSTLLATKYATSPINYFDCNMFTGINSLLPNTNYHVYVAINYYGTGEYDHDCVIKTPAALKQEDLVSDFKAVAYPNPFANTFMIDVKSSSQASVNLKVYDMIGRLIEQRDVRVSDLETTTLGDRYPSGVYNVVVSQESSVQTVRVVKR